jgi:Domain of unknown function (DUF4328)
MSDAGTPPAPPPPPPGAAPPPPPAAVGASEWYSLRGLTTALSVLLWTTVAASVLGAYAWANRVSVESDLIDGDIEFDILSRANDADDLVGAAIFLMGLLSLAIFVLIIIWTFRAMKNNEALGRTNARFTPGWGIAGWLIPFANLVIPVLIFQDLWRGSDQSVARADPNWRRAKGSGLVGWWWAMHIIAGARFGGFGGTARYDDEDELESLRRSDTIGLVGMVFAIAAAILAIQVIRKIAGRQEECRQGAAVAAAPPPPPGPVAPT